MPNIKRIVTPYPCGDKIAERMGCSTIQVSRALNFKKNSPLCINIRKLAMEEFYGKIVEWYHVPKQLDED